MEGTNFSLITQNQCFMQESKQERGDQMGEIITAIASFAITGVVIIFRKILVQKFQAHKQRVLESVKRNGLMLEYVSKEFKSDREVVLAAVTQNGHALLYASSRLQEDKQLVLAAVRQDYTVIAGTMSPQFYADREVMLAAVRQNGHALSRATLELQGDRDMVLEAVSQTGYALEYATEELRGDREIVFTAISQTQGAIVFASRHLQIEFAYLVANHIIQRLDLDQETANERLIREGADFILKEVLALAAQETIEEFSIMNVEIMQFVATKAAYIYAFGAKQTEVLPNFFKDETKNIILDLRRAAVSTDQKEELARLMENPDSYGGEVKETSVQSIFNRLREAGSKELIPIGFFIRECYQRAIKNLAP